MLTFFYFLIGLWGRHKHNRIKEVGCTISHLMTIHQACQDALQSGKKYAMITEDDIFFPFEVNYTALIETAPNDFGILQVFNSNEGSMENTYRQYRSKGRYVELTLAIGLVFKIVSDGIGYG